MNNYVLRSVHYLFFVHPSPNSAIPPPLTHLKRWQTPAEVRAHRKAQAKYQKSPDEVQKRENRNLARAHMAKLGKVHKGDDKDVEHVDGNAKNNSPINWRVGTRKHNRSYARDEHAHKVDPHS